MLLGTLVGFPERERWQALDVGSGDSALPGYLLETGNAARVTALDLPEAFERRSHETRRRDAARGNIDWLDGSMLAIPAGDRTFELVTCISAIEHLDGDPMQVKRNPAAPGPVPYDDFLARTRLALDEMARVLAPGGLLFVTSDAFIEGRQTSDGWTAPHEDGRIWSAYRFGDIDDVFARAITENDLEFIGERGHRRDLLEADRSRSTYRGRFFTTFAIVARRPGPASSCP
jgi:SAM-dependent methyltransferase